MSGLSERFRSGVNNGVNAPQIGAQGDVAENDGLVNWAVVRKHRVQVLTWVALTATLLSLLLVLILPYAYLALVLMLVCLVLVSAASGLALFVTVWSQRSREPKVSSGTASVERKAPQPRRT
jgi:hypothetical protein